ncbi:MAG: 3-deoxy-D-manno-octulosonate cytidylyltransferase [bacterium P3]|nr:MAG: 3-deoxy-D-manno-octulosonate cytidylyltransferase [bacterium P3]KWW42325.1 MAG: 3-deoxy-D-manno-octulosonate cytidylyltransferase [bacterium F083]
MNALAIIPARYASTRFPGKPLALLDGKPIIQRVWERVSDAVGADAAVVATDDERIVAAVRGFGGQVRMTRTDHRSGTDRCGEVLTALEEDGAHFDIVVNVQGDEPFVRRDQLTALIGRFDKAEVQIATLRTPIRSADALWSPNNVKVVADSDGRALYFSRHPLPYQRGTEPKNWTEKHVYYKHVGVYAFRSEVLKRLVQLPTGMLERCESLEQLRWMEHGYPIHLCDTGWENIGIDTPEDLQLAERELHQTHTN